MAHRRVCCSGGILLLLLLFGSEARIHKLTLNNETRSSVDLNNFGFYANGTLDVKLVSLRLPEINYTMYPLGFTLSRSRVNGVLSYTAEETDTCPLTVPKTSNSEPLLLFLIDINNVTVKVMGDQDNLLIAKPKEVQKEGEGGEEQRFQLDKMNPMTLALDKVNGSYSFSFHIVFSLLAEGPYTLKFHYCHNKGPVKKLPYFFSVEVTEKNPGGYLSAAEIPLSRLYIGMAGVFFTAAMVWVYTLMKHRYSVFKIHWLMAALAFTKAISLVFHSINYHFINTEGHPIEGWAVMYYITHLLKGALLFITLALIGTGWAFVKYILSDKEKKIFMIVIPLQVLANVAYIIIESTEEGSIEYYLWKEILFLVDLICCGAILFPVVWSIRHLQEASSTDGKAAMNLEKLKLFRHYYVMIVCYIYFTRIIAILLKVTMPFQWQWCYEFLVEVSTLIFFVLTGYKFRPASNNPYLQLPLDEEDVEMDEVVTESGALEGISKVKKTCNGQRPRESTL
ncbi:Protein GPR108 [Dissostichus eleginoides]|uniref:Protein GPR108 n=1 Tax=Dissostichus eleginoides TaxID=100907 RepID=A0AAD9BNL1_DISEL|nr:Protein GPR108 [Dissostichus eleginoides]